MSLGGGGFGGFGSPEPAVGDFGDWKLLRQHQQFGSEPAVGGLGGVGVGGFGSPVPNTVGDFGGGGFETAPHAPHPAPPFPPPPGSLSTCARVCGGAYCTQVHVFGIE
jgi:hypothetical protein